MNIISFNLHHCSKKAILACPLILEKHVPQLLVFTEFLHNAEGRKLESILKSNEFNILVSAPAQSGSVLVASKYEAVPLTVPFNAKQFRMPEELRSRVIGMKTAGINVIGVYLPQGDDRADYLNEMSKLDGVFLEQKTLIVGDFNVGDKMRDGYDHYPRSVYRKTFEAFDRLNATGWIDAWRETHSSSKERTWYFKKTGRGFRIDHMFMSPPLYEKMKLVEYSHEERESCISDHSLMFAEIN